MTLHECITKVQSVKGKEKQTFLLSLKETDPQLFSDVAEYLSMVYGTENWYQTTIKSVGPLMVMGKPKMSAIEIIKTFFSGERRGNAGANLLGSLVARAETQGDKDLVQYAMWKDIKAGLGPISINKVFPNLIFIPPYQRCSTVTKGYLNSWDWETGIFIQKKEDQMFGNLICSEEPYLRSRNWNLIDGGSTKPLKDAGMWVREQLGDCVVMGEIIVLDSEGVPLGRESSNGLVNGIIQTGEELPEGNTISMKVWNCVPLDDFMKGETEHSYETLFSDLECVMEENTGNYPLSMVQSDRVTTIQQALEIFVKILKEKGEGVVMKNPRGLWSHNDGGSKDEIKVKIEMEVDLEITAINEAEAKSKHVDTFASLECKSSDGRIITGISGMTDAKRMEIHLNREKYIGSVIAAKCNGIQYNPEEPHSIYFGQFLESRLDKTTANSFEEIVEIQEAAIRTRLMIEAK